MIYIHAPVINLHHVYYDTTDMIRISYNITDNQIIPSNWFSQSIKKNPSPLYMARSNINGTSVRELYIYIWYVGHPIIASYGHEREIVYCAFSCLTLQAVYIPF